MSENDCAFPHPTTRGRYMKRNAGLTKRELFAAMAMQGILSNSESEPEDTIHNSIVAVRNADALIAELNKEKP